LRSTTLRKRSLRAASMTARAKERQQLGRLPGLATNHARKA
jgi:hypothetical protein